MYWVTPQAPGVLPTVYTDLYDAAGRQIPNTLPSTPTIPYNLLDGEPVVTTPVLLEELLSRWTENYVMHSQRVAHAQLRRAQEQVGVLEARRVRAVEREVRGHQVAALDLDARQVLEVQRLEGLPERPALPETRGTEGRHEQPALAVEALRHQLDRDPRLGRDQRHRRAVPAVLGEQPGRRVAVGDLAGQRLGGRARHKEGGADRHPSHAPGRVHGRSPTSASPQLEAAQLDQGLGVAEPQGHGRDVREDALPLGADLLHARASDRLRLWAVAAATGEWLQGGWWANCRAWNAARLLGALDQIPPGAAATQAVELRRLLHRAQRVLP